MENNRPLDVIFQKNLMLLYEMKMQIRFGNESNNKTTILKGIYMCALSYYLY